MATFFSLSAPSPCDSPCAPLNRVFAASPRVACLEGFFHQSSPHSLSGRAMDAEGTPMGAFSASCTDAHRPPCT